MENGDVMELRRATDHGLADGAYILAILYTIGYLVLIGALMLVDIPSNNRELLISLVSIMSAAQLGIIKYYYDGSKAADKVQTANIARSLKSEAVVQEIAKAVPAVQSTTEVKP
ncbi:MAG: hypothetical protein NUV34_03120 [Sulfuricaulis sp.]|nr:hypothetical protein [Sulfuricaulis sp.]